MDCEHWKNEFGRVKKRSMGYLVQTCKWESRYDRCVQSSPIVPVRIATAAGDQYKPDWAFHAAFPPMSVRCHDWDARLDTLQLTNRPIGYLGSRNSLLDMLLYSPSWLQHSKEPASTTHTANFLSPNSAAKVLLWCCGGAGHTLCAYLVTEIAGSNATKAYAERKPNQIAMASAKSQTRWMRNDA